MPLYSENTGQKPACRPLRQGALSDLDSLPMAFMSIQLEVYIK